MAYYYFYTYKNHLDSLRVRFVNLINNLQQKTVGKSY